MRKDLCTEKDFNGKGRQVEKENWTQSSSRRSKKLNVEQCLLGNETMNAPRYEKRFWKGRVVRQLVRGLPTSLI